jgi:hypothetical protein
MKRLLLANFSSNRTNQIYIFSYNTHEKIAPSKIALFDRLLSATTNHSNNISALVISGIFRVSPIFVGINRGFSGGHSRK